MTLVPRAQKLQVTKVYHRVDLAVKKGFTLISAQGSTRSSKTYNILIYLIVHLLNNPKTKLSIVRATLPALKGSVLEDFKEIMQKYKWWDDKAFNKSDLIYELPNGSRIEFWSTDSEQKIRGRKRHILYANEANEISFMEWKQLKLRTTKFSIIDYNPSFTEDHWLNEVNKDPRTKHFITTYKDNPFLEQTVIDEIESLRETNPSLWRIYGLGLRAIVEGLIFKDINVILEMPKGLKHRWRGIDFGYTNDPTAIIDVAIRDNALYLDELCYRTRMLTNDIIDELKDDPFETEIVSESADPRLVAEIENTGLYIEAVEKFPGSVEAGINKMLGYKIFITKRSVNLLKEFRNYTYTQNKEGVWLNKPIDKFNHGIDAIRYVILTKVLGGNHPEIDPTKILNAFR